LALETMPTPEKMAPAPTVPLTVGSLADDAVTCTEPGTLMVVVLPSADAPARGPTKASTVPPTSAVALAPEPLPPRAMARANRSAVALRVSADAATWRLPAPTVAPSPT